MDRMHNHLSRQWPQLIRVLQWSWAVRPWTDAKPLLFSRPDRMINMIAARTRLSARSTYLLSLCMVAERCWITLSLRVPWCCTLEHGCWHPAIAMVNTSLLSIKASCSCRTYGFFPLMSIEILVRMPARTVSLSRILWFALLFHCLWFWPVSLVFSSAQFWLSIHVRNPRII